MVMKVVATAVGMFLGLVWYVVDRKALGDAGLHPAVSSPEDAAQARSKLWRAVGGTVAVAALIHSPGQAEPFLEKNLKRPLPADPKRLASLVANLDSPIFSVRDKANRGACPASSHFEPSESLSPTRI